MHVLLDVVEKMRWLLEKKRSFNDLSKDRATNFPALAIVVPFRQSNSTAARKQPAQMMQYGNENRANKQIACADILWSEN